MTSQFPPDSGVLDAGLTLRRVRQDDLNAVAQLSYDMSAADGDISVADTPEDIASDWDFAGFSLEQDAFLVEANSEQVVGYIALFDVTAHCELIADLYVHPDFKQRGVASALLRAIEIRAREVIQLGAPGLRAYVRVTIHNQDEINKSVLVREAYSPIRHQWRMAIDLDAAPSAPELPAGMVFRPFVQEAHAESVWLAHNEAFLDHWGSRVQTFEEFSYETFEISEYDPDLWRVVWDGEEVAGFCINMYRNGIGWVRNLGVRPAWRTQGLGYAMLLHSFAMFYQRGMKTIGLGVDAANPTGAVRLYRKAGMQVASEFVTFEKELRPRRFDLPKS